MSQRQIIKCCAGDLNTVAALYDKTVTHLENTINYPRWTSGVYPCRESVANICVSKTEKQSARLF